MTATTRNASDHDILTTLVEAVRGNHAVLLDKISDMRTDINAIKDGTNKELGDHESRLRVMEALVIKYSPEPLVSMINAHDGWIRDFKVTWRVLMVLGMGISSLVTFILTVILNIMNILHFK